MAATIAAFTLAGSTLSISAALPATNTKTAYAALTFTPIGEITDFGTMGRVYTTVKFSPVATRGVRKYKGSYDEGQQALKVAYAPGDPGRIIVDAAVPDDAFYSFKIALKDGTIIYHQSQVSSAPIEMGTVDGIVMSTINLEIKSGASIIVPAV